MKEAPSQKIVHLHPPYVACISQLDQSTDPSACSSSVDCRAFGVELYPVKQYPLYQDISLTFDCGLVVVSFWRRVTEAMLATALRYEEIRFLSQRHLRYACTSCRRTKYNRAFHESGHLPRVGSGRVGSG